MTGRSFLSLLTGSFSTPAAGNPTVAMVEAAYRHHGIDAIYVNCEVAPHALADAVRGARAMQWAGFNCSLPHKVAVVGHLDGVSDSAALIGAVNCVVRHGDLYIGENTDGKGFVSSLRATVDPRGATVCVLGAGGAARAVAFELALAGAAAITIVNRDRARGADLVSALAESTAVRADLVAWEGALRVPEEVGILVNATSAGLAPDVDTSPDVEVASLREGLVVADVIPNPPTTRFLRDAEARGCRTLDGLGMLVEQGAIGVARWTGVDPDRTVMRKALEAVTRGE